MKRNETQVRLNFCLFSGVLILKRVPKYLRFVCKNIGMGERKWDALDQLDDEPEDDEEVMAGILADSSKVHIDRRVNGKHVGEWRSTATYDLVKEHPDDSVLRSTELWRKWCGEIEAANELARQSKADHCESDPPGGNRRHKSVEKSVE